MTRPTVAQAESWRPEALGELADAWYRLARDVFARVRAAASATPDGWHGEAADAARTRLEACRDDGEAVARTLVLASAAARDGAGQLTDAQRQVTRWVGIARGEGFHVTDQGTVVASTQADQVRADELSDALTSALVALGEADADAARDIADAFVAAPPVPGGPFGEELAQSRQDIAQAILSEPLDDRASVERMAFYHGLISEVDDPAGSGERVDRQIIAFDPDQQVLIEVNGDLRNASDVAVLVPGMNTTIEGSASNTVTARQFVAGSEGEVAAITFLGGPFPQSGLLPLALLKAAQPQYALGMAPRLALFSHRLERELAELNRDVPVTVVGHSYGGSILGTAEGAGLTADRTVYVAAAGSGIDVDRPAEWNNANPDVRRFSMTAPGDPIGWVQGIPGGPHGADPDELPGVIHLGTGRYADGRPMTGIASHTDIINAVDSDSWRNILAIITGDDTRFARAR